MGRPTGMTVLAVFNFLGALSALGLAALNLNELGATGRLTAAAAVSNGLAGALGLLLLASGIGYLGGKRVMGRYLGNAYAVAALGFSVLTIATGAFAAGTLVAIVYPVVTLACINGPYKEWLAG